jgi:prevent-host-death family protein
MITVNTREAKLKLSALLAAVEERGERVRICRNGKPAAELVPIRPPRDPLSPHPELSRVVIHEDPALALSDEEWPEQFR